MLNRRILRIKAFKAVYALAENPAMTTAEALDNLESSCQATRDLYLFMLALIPALTAEAASRLAAAQAKFNPTEEERHPNFKFVHNGIAPLLEEDPDFQKIIKKKQLSWDQYDVFLRHLYDTLKASDYFAEYMASDTASLEEDARLFVTIYERELVDNTELEEILEDLSIWWNDDLAYSLTYCCHAVNDLAAGKRWAMPELYLSQMPGQNRKESDRDFVRSVVSEAVRSFSASVESISALTPKWDKNRICTTDLALIVCGMAEAAACPQTAPRIIMNEYVEISKFFSTSASSAFVNGLLDKLINKQ
ncbi:MAG: hypothetical protein KBS55_02230 [Bacteroidales bacterium]|nr:hypothetical protein [Candidatus Cryptobacteroides aphodequi]